MTLTNNLTDLIIYVSVYIGLHLMNNTHELPEI